MSLRIAMEAFYQLEAVEEYGRLATLASNLPVFSALWKNDRMEALRLWRRLHNAGFQPTEHLASGIEARHDESEAFHASLLDVIDFHHQRQELEPALTYLLRRLEWVDARNDAKLRMEALRGIALVYVRQGDKDQTRKYILESLALARRHGILDGEASAISVLGTLAYMDSDTTGALEHFFQLIPICERLGDERQLAKIVGNIGAVRLEQGFFSEAEQYLERQYEIDSRRGDRFALSTVTGNLAELRIMTGKPEEALALFRKAYDLAHDVGFTYQLPYWLNGMARTLLELASNHDIGDDLKGTWLTESELRANEAIELSTSLKLSTCVFTAKVLLARIAAETDPHRGVSELETLLAESISEFNRVDLHYWLWKLDPTRTRDRVAAAELSASLYISTQRFEYARRVAELNGSRIPQSADDL